MLGLVVDVCDVSHVQWYLLFMHHILSLTFPSLIGLYLEFSGIHVRKGK